MNKPHQRSTWRCLPAILLRRSIGALLGRWHSAIRGRRHISHHGNVEEENATHRWAAQPAPQEAPTKLRRTNHPPPLLLRVAPPPCLLVAPAAPPPARRPRAPRACPPCYPAAAAAGGATKAEPPQCWRTPDATIRRRETGKQAPVFVAPPVCPRERCPNNPKHVRRRRPNSRAAPRARRNASLPDELLRATARSGGAAAPAPSAAPSAPPAGPRRDWPLLLFPRLLLLCGLTHTPRQEHVTIPL